MCHCQLGSRRVKEGFRKLQEGLLVFTSWASLQGKAAACSSCFHPGLCLHFMVLQVNRSREAQEQATQILAMFRWRGRFGGGQHLNGMLPGVVR